MFHFLPRTHRSAWPFLVSPLRYTHTFLYLFLLLFLHSHDMRSFILLLFFSSFILIFCFFPLLLPPSYLPASLSLVIFIALHLPTPPSPLRHCAPLHTCHSLALSCRGVVRVDVNLQDVDIDQCSTSGWFAGTHRCNLTSMEVSRPHAINIHIYSHFTHFTLFFFYSFWNAADEVDVRYI